MHLISAKHKYPLFFLGLAIMLITAFFYKLGLVPLAAVEVFIAIGFVVFVFAFLPENIGKK